MIPTRGYLLCCIERTGSTLLGQALTGTGIAGCPREYFNAVELEKPWMRGILGNCSLADGLPKILTSGTTANGMFGAKIHWSHPRHLGMRITGEWSDAKRLLLMDLLRSQSPILSPAAARELLRSRAPDLRWHAISFALLRSWLPDLRVIWLRRKNMVARAISHFRALRTGRWYLAATNKDTVPTEQPPEFDFAEIHHSYCLGSFQEELWQKFFEQEGISPLPVVYEELVADYEATVQRVLRFLDLATDQVVIRSPLILKQSDALSEEWEARYRELSAVAWS